MQRAQRRTKARIQQPAQQPRRRPGPAPQRSASISSTSSSRVSTSSRATRSARVSSWIIRTSAVSRASPCTWITSGSNETSTPLSGVAKSQCPTSISTSGVPPGRPRRKWPGLVSIRAGGAPGGGGSRLVEAKSWIAGTSTKSPGPMMRGGCPWIVSRICPAIIAQ